MREIFDVAAVRAAEADAMQDTPDGLLMQRASFGLAMECLRLLTTRYGSAYGRTVVVLSGTGGNGGDALYAGLFLSQRGCHVRAVLTRPDRVFPAAMSAWKSAGLATLSVEDADISTLVGGADLLLDGLVGLGGHGAVELPTDVFQAWQLRRGIAVAVDIPSGLNVDTGAAYERVLDADATVTFGSSKPAHVLAPAKQFCGEVIVVDIGLGSYLSDPALQILGQDDITAIWPIQPYEGNKYSTGVVAVVAGSDKYSGAALLSVGGAVRAKSGMVRFIGDGSVAGLVRARWPEVVVSATVADAGRTNAWVLGPGMGTDEAAAEMVRTVLAVDVPVIVDADGLTVLAKNLDLLESRTAPTVLTPHSGEFERLFGPVGGDPVGRVQAVANQYDVVVLLKGATTIVAAPDGTTYINPTATADLATAGTGDVLAGMVGAMLAAGIDPPLAAAAAAYVHGLAGASARRPVIAEDLIRALPVLLTELLD